MSYIGNKSIIDYDIWWQQDEILSVINIDFNCQQCKSLLSLAFVNYEYQVTIKTK